MERHNRLYSEFVTLQRRQTQGRAARGQLGQLKFNRPDLFGQPAAADTVETVTEQNQLPPPAIKPQFDDDGIPYAGETRTVYGDQGVTYPFFSYADLRAMFDADQHRQLEYLENEVRLKHNLDEKEQALLSKLRERYGQPAEVKLFFRTELESIERIEARRERIKAESIKD